MSLNTWEAADRLYLARGDEVSDHRPLFTGDVFDNVPIPGVHDDGMAVVVAHPCSMRGREARLEERLLLASVRPHEYVPATRWGSGYYGRMPLPDLLPKDPTFHAGWLDEVGRATRGDVERATRVACLSPVGINLLQQRLVFRLTRAEIPTSTF